MSTKAYYPISEIGAGKPGFSKTRSIIEAAFYGNNVIKVDTLKEAYDEALLNEEDLKNISCGYYELYQFDIYSEYENLYSGLYDPHEELSQSKERELKLAYLEHIKHPEYSDDSVKILYYGTYNGNIVAGLSCDYIIIDIVSHEKFEIGGVMFYKFWEGRILVYHCS